MSRRHVVLVGLPGSGKSMAGAAAASLLGARFADVDREVERAAGRTVAQLFAELGEAAFRRRERAATDALLAGPPMVLAPGGGWFLHAEARARALASAFVVYLTVEPHVAWQRLGGSAGRPLLEGGDGLARLTQLWRERETVYVTAHVQVATDALDVAQVAERIAELARAKAGW